ncbi:2634_t:CDS:2 [Ambispora leptoticha]|uniref:2634_t:CDS:1 n=1 Tax=Ambispora leptoticha TaxID=144679 RepID=A0A9N9G9N8_9GLOM|nr:2634_t:CDS:2 [Ambispora leptoticha]
MKPSTSSLPQQQLNDLSKISFQKSKLKNAGQCQRRECNNKTQTQTINFKLKYEYYCSEDCYWKDIEQLTTTKAVLLDKNDMDYDRVAKPFKEKLPKSKIRAILRLQMPHSISKAHRECKQKNDYKATHKMYHGTSILCNAANFLKGKQDCTIENCGMCGITAQGNQSSFSHYGTKMWFAKNPQTSLSYCSGKSKFKAMFAVDVIARDDNEILIVTKNELTLPRYLIIFTRTKWDRYLTCWC